MNYFLRKSESTLDESKTQPGKETQHFIFLSI
jgi:hypothetical protein